jgi:hypothetical protein
VFLAVVGLPGTISQLVLIMETGMEFIVSGELAVKMKQN